MSRTPALIVLLAITFARPAAAQRPYRVDVLQDIPAGSNIFSLIESAEAEVTTDRFNSGGLNAGEPERGSAFLASWSQTRYSIGGALISSPIDGTPMVFPELALWELIDVSTTTGGLSIGLTPRKPARRAVFEAIGSGGELTQPSSSSRPPAIAQLGDFAHISGMVTGDAINTKLSFTVGGVFTRATTFERHGERRRDTRSAFLNWSFAPSRQHTFRGVALAQQHARHFQSSYERGRLVVSGTHTDRTRDAGSSPQFRHADRLVDGPIPSLVESRVNERRWSAAARFLVASTAHHHAITSVNFDRASSVIAPVSASTVFERVDGVPARLWRYGSPGVDSRRHASVITARVSDRVDVTPGIRIDGALQFDSVSGSADGATTGIGWRTLLPSIDFEWNLGTPAKLRLRTGVSRTADLPLLGLLAYGDPAAPTADVFRWDGENILPPPLMMRVGPGTGGNPAFSAIDSKLKRPVTDQFILQLESNPKPSLRLRVTGLARRQSSLIHVVNIGVSPSGYSTFTIPDANADWVNPVDDQQLLVFNRNPETFGQDRYLLTNPDVEDATMGAVVVSGEVAKPRVLFRISGTASASVGSGGNRGFTAIENDQSMPGELFTSPNASTYARGRLFNDRAYTIKSLAIVRFPSEISVGALARFQDGQPFSRLAIVPFLNQGAEAIQTFPRGRSRFSYRATLDVRLQKKLNFGVRRLDLFADAYNLLNASSEVEEYVVTGPRFREITAVQPPRSFHLGARATFN